MIDSIPTLLMIFTAGLFPIMLWGLTYIRNKELTVSDVWDKVLKDNGRICNIYNLFPRMSFGEVLPYWIIVVLFAVVSILILNSFFPSFTRGFFRNSEAVFTISVSLTTIVSALLAAVFTVQKKNMLVFSLRDLIEKNQLIFWIQGVFGGVALVTLSNLLILGIDDTYIDGHNSDYCRIVLVMIQVGISINAMSSGVVIFRVLGMLLTDADLKMLDRLYFIIRNKNYDRSGIKESDAWTLNAVKRNLNYLFKRYIEASDHVRWEKERLFYFGGASEHLLSNMRKAIKNVGIFQIMTFIICLIYLATLPEIIDFWTEFLLMVVFFVYSLCLLFFIVQIFKEKDEGRTIMSFLYLGQIDEYGYYVIDKQSKRYYSLTPLYWFLIRNRRFLVTRNNLAAFFRVYVENVCLKDDTQLEEIINLGTEVYTKYTKNKNDCMKLMFSMPFLMLAYLLLIHGKNCDTLLNFFKNELMRYQMKKDDIIRTVLRETLLYVEDVKSIEKVEDERERYTKTQIEFLNKLGME